MYSNDSGTATFFSESVTQNACVTLGEGCDPNNRNRLLATDVLVAPVIAGEGKGLSLCFLQTKSYLVATTLTRKINK